MAVDIRVPAVGESITEGVLSRWLKKNGASVRAGEPLFELETDKASQEVPAPSAGVLAITVPEGSKVAIGSVVGRIEAAAVPSRDSPAVPVNEVKATTAPSAEPLLSPAARQLVADQGLDAQQVAGSGREGRILKEDVLRHLESNRTAPSAPTPPLAPETPPVVQVSLPIPDAPRGETRQRMSGIRQRIAERLVEAKTRAAILTTFNEIDMSAVMALRARYKDSFQKKHGVGLGFMSFFVRASIEALRAFPVVNSRIEGSDVVTPQYQDVGVAVSTERGLMVPVLRDAGRMTFAQIEKAIADLGQRARDNKISVGDLQGGTFTITNGGVFGSLLSTPILNPPQSGILGMHTIQKRPVALNDQVVIRPMMYVALSYDHRLIDGREAVSFLVRVKECVESPEQLLLEV